MTFGRALGLLSMLAAASPGAAAQPTAPTAQAAPRFERLDSRDGLAHNTVLALARDRDGFVWVGTADGLCRYDGYGFTVFRHRPGRPDTLPDNTVQALLATPDGDLWVGTADGVARLDRRTGRFVRYAPAGADVSALLPGPRGTVWAHTYGGHLLRFDRALGVVGDEGMRGARPAAVAPDGALWRIDQGPGADLLVRRASATEPFRLVLSLGRRRVGGFHVGPTGTVWLDEPDLDRPVAGGRLRSLPPLPGGRTYHEAEANDILEGRSGVIWVGMRDGLYRYDPATGAGAVVPLDLAGDALRSYVLALMEDPDGGLWVGTRSGLYRHDPYRATFDHLGPGAGLPDEPGSGPGQALGPVMAVHEDAAGALWLGTLGSGLLRRDPATGAVMRYRHRADDAGTLPSDNVWALLPAPGGALWAGTDGGLAVLDPATGRARRVPLPPAGPSERRFIYVLVPDGRGGVWAGGGALLFNLDAATGRVRRTVDVLPIVGAATVEALRVDRRGTLWVGTEKRGLWALDPGGGLTRAAAVPASATVWAIHEGRGGRLWLGTGGGLARLDPATGALTRHDEPGRPAAVVYSILGDDAGRLWLGTGAGLRRLDPRTGRSRAYDAGDGLVNGEFNRRAAAVGAGGRLYFGGLDGVTTFDAAAVRDNSNAPPVVLTRVTRAGRGGVVALDPRRLGPDGLRLAPRDLVVAFEYVALGFTNAARNRYAYTLEGFDAGWVDAGGTRAVRYTSLPPGAYTFRVRAANADGVWNEAGAALPVVVLPPYWQTWWFRLLALAAAAGALSAAYIARVRRLLTLERMRLRIAGDLHDDIGSKLGSIALMTELVATRAPLAERERGQLEEVAQVARRMAGDLRDIVWLVRPGHDTLGDLALKLEHVAARMLDGVAVAVEADGEAAAPLSMESRRHLFLAYHELLHNVARHARARRVAVRLAREGRALVLEVRDDGAGFDPAAVTDGAGLASLRERARQLGGRLEVESRPGAGAALRLVVPLG